MTDARARLASFGDFGLVHKGFKTTFDSCMLEISLSGANHAIRNDPLVRR